MYKYTLLLFDLPLTRFALEAESEVLIQELCVWLVLVELFELL